MIIQNIIADRLSL